MLLTWKQKYCTYIPNNVFSASIKRWWLFFRTSVSKTWRLCWYFALPGGWALAYWATHRAFFQEDLRNWTLLQSISSKDLLHGQVIWIGTTARGCFGTEVMWPCQISQWKVKYKKIFRSSEVGGPIDVICSMDGSFENKVLVTPYL